MSKTPIRVSQLNSYIKRILQTDPLLGSVYVVGEVSNVKYHGTGHVYFTLKDENSKINCFLASSYVKYLSFALEDGMEIKAEGYIYLYEKGGSYSLNIRDVQLSGEGALSVAFEKLKRKLAAEGLFDPAHKKPLPAFPNRIAVVTSETGAAVRDILKIIKNRNNYVDVLIFPVLVQGPGAPADIARAIDTLNRDFNDIDLMIVGRGGGSLEELWAFNEECVARSIYASRIPVISAVGHEIDVTISDFVADRRAETPTAAAQMAVPDIVELKAYIDKLREEVFFSIGRILEYKTLRAKNSSPAAMAAKLTSNLERQEEKLKFIRRNLLSDFNNLRERSLQKVQACRREIEALSPENIMLRGYSAILNQEGRLVSSVREFKKGSRFTACMADGKVTGEIIEIEEKS